MRSLNLLSGRTCVNESDFILFIQIQFALDSLVAIQRTKNKIQKVFCYLNLFLTDEGKYLSEGASRNLSPALLRLSANQITRLPSLSLLVFSLCFAKVALSDISDETTGYTPDERRMGSVTSNHRMHRQFTIQRVEFYFQNNWMPHWPNSTPWQEMKENPYPLRRKHPSRSLEPPGNIQCTLMSARGAKAEGVPFLCKLVAPIDSYPFLHAFLTDWRG